ncbi:MAG TPA: hypothetical protein VL916_17190, partial [Ilumatobacteraceae bacterium]|nr:hypothetical protein [Ilumatobacteraceae bacterium]
VAPLDAKRPLTGERSVNAGPIYDPAQDKMLGGVINTYSTLAFAETTFGLPRSERRLGSVSELNRRSMANRAAINEWVAAHPMLELGVAEPERRGAAVTLLKVNDRDITDPAIHARVRDEIDAALIDAGCRVVGWTDSPIQGGDGNREFLVHAVVERPGFPA